jgi:hypothetical protein
MHSFKSLREKSSSEEAFGGDWSNSAQTSSQFRNFREIIREFRELREFLWNSVNFREKSSSEEAFGVDWSN